MLEWLSVPRQDRTITNIASRSVWALYTTHCLSSFVAKMSKRVPGWILAQQRAWHFSTVLSRLSFSASSFSLSSSCATSRNEISSEIGEPLLSKYPSLVSNRAGELAFLWWFSSWAKSNCLRLTARCTNASHSNNRLSVEHKSNGTMTSCIWKAICSTNKQYNSLDIADVCKVFGPFHRTWGNLFDTRITFCRSQYWFIGSAMKWNHKASLPPCSVKQFLESLCTGASCDARISRFWFLSEHPIDRPLFATDLKLVYFPW